eukprot:TRINITY_DN7215_c0_g1_i1.p1 TRINITY_DN7215_c0_g1~~TRINITY_DN7215_c0_g1_i1.p1  ORF type:complete len:916 (-),score=159.66 TRINITY_DN7215_c0_g1_i1:120-2531(-)
MSEEEVKSWTNLKYAKAIEYCQKALNIVSLPLMFATPEQIELMNDSKIQSSIRLSSLYASLKDFETAIKILEPLSGNNLENVNTTLSGYYIESGDIQKALELSENLVKKYPKNIDNYENLSKIYDQLGNKDKSTEMKEIFEFCNWVSPTFLDFIDFAEWNTVFRRFCEEKLETLEDLSNGKLIPPPSPIQDGSSRMKEMFAFLSVVCYHHYHGTVEEKAFAILSQHSTKDGVVDLMIKLIEGSKSVCTVKGAARVLAESKHPIALNILLRLLPQDVSLFRMEIPESLVKLGDVRAVPSLIQCAHIYDSDEVMVEYDDSDDEIFENVLRCQCCYALGHFLDKDPTVLDALVHGTTVSEISEDCAAVLACAKKQPQYLEIIREKLVSENLSYTTSNYLTQWAAEDPSIATFLSDCEESKKVEKMRKLEIERVGISSWTPNQKQIDKMETGSGDFASVKMNSLPDMFFEYIQLVQLNFSNCRFREFDSRLSTLTNLQTLDLSYNLLSGPLDSSIGSLKSLLVLNLSNNQLTSLPESIGELNNLKQLNVSDNSLENLPIQISQLASLLDLIGSQNSIHHLPDDIFTGLKLTSLLLDSNQITDIPRSLSTITTLIHVSFSNNKLTSIPDDMFTSNSCLTNLDLHRNQINSIPSSMSKIKSCHIDLSENNVSKFPFKLLEILDHLSLSNRFVGFDDGVNRFVGFDEGVAVMKHNPTWTRSGPEVMSLKELSGRIILDNTIPLVNVTNMDIIEYLNSFKKCDLCNKSYDEHCYVVQMMIRENQFQGTFCRYHQEEIKEYLEKYGSSQSWQ